MARETVTIAGRQVSAKDLEYVAAPLKEFNAGTTPPVNLILEASVEQLVQTISITILPVATYLLLQIGDKIFDKVTDRVVEIFSKRMEPHTFITDCKVGGVPLRVLIDAPDSKEISKAMKKGYKKFKKAVELMSEPSFPKDALGVGVEYDVKLGDFRIRRNLNGKTTEYDEKSGSWK